MATLGVIYRFAPNRRGARVGWVTPGAFLAVALWALISIGFSLYLANFNTYNRVYGSIGAVVALLMWVYLSAFAVLLGAGFNASLWREKRDTGQA